MGQPNGTWNPSAVVLGRINYANPHSTTLTEKLLHDAQRFPTTIKRKLQERIIRRDLSKRLKLQDYDVDLAVKWRITNPNPDDIDDHYDVKSIVQHYSLSLATQSEYESTLETDDEALIEKYRRDVASASEPTSDLTQ